MAADPGRPRSAPVGERLTPPPGGGVGRLALAAFAQAFGADSPRAAMQAACDRLRARVAAAGWKPGLDAYLRAFGLRVLEAPIPTAGRLDYEDGCYLIRVQRAADLDDRRPPTPLAVADASNRQRFSIAHEIGHALLLECLGRQPEHLPGLYDPAAWPEIERLCDRAAADLLVPLDEFLAAVGQRGCAPRAIERLAEGFRVSLEVISLRFLTAGARSISQWQVRAAPDAPGGFGVTVVRAYRSGRAPSFDSGTPSSGLAPDLVRQVACGGRARAKHLLVTGGASAWQGAGLADGGALRASPSEPVQLRWLHDESSEADSLPATSPVRGGLDAQITLLLFPARPAPDDAQLWASLCKPLVGV